MMVGIASLLSHILYYDDSKNNKFHFFIKTPLRLRFAAAQPKLDPIFLFLLYLSLSPDR